MGGRPVRPRLTIRATPNPAAAGTTIVISGRLTGAGPNRQVALWQKLAARLRFFVLAIARTKQLGRYRIVRHRDAG